ncbi:hypothetical protein KAT51_08295 [bacterium]|nr:hypothetical protein [bacterium]
MKAELDYQSGYKPIIRLIAETDDEKYALKLLWEQGCQRVSYNGSEKFAVTCGKEQD